MAKYANYQKVCDSLFVVFTILWIATRTGIYPFWIIRNTTIEAPKIVPMFPAYYIFNSLLILLLGLHMIWTYLILKIAYNAFYAGQVNRKSIISQVIQLLNQYWIHNYFRWREIFGATAVTRFRTLPTGLLIIRTTQLDRVSVRKTNDSGIYFLRSNWL